MSNIHRISDFEDREAGSGGNRRAVPLLGGSLGTGSPRRESFFSFIKNFCCPLSTWKSFIFAISMIDIIMYIITLSFGIGLSTPEAPYFLPPLPGTLEKFGSLNPIKLRNYEIWRWVSYSVLHADLVHLLSNVISQIIIGSYIEMILGHSKTALLYFVSTILGALFAVLISSSPSIGASIAVYGLLGCYIGYTFINWNYLDTLYGPINKCLNLFFIFFIVMLGFSSQINNPMINFWGHLGGLFAGFFFSFIVLKPYDINDGVCCPNKIWVTLSSLLLLIFTITGFTLFYVLDHYKKY